MVEPDAKHHLMLPVTMHAWVSCQAVLGVSLEQATTYVRSVRDVAPNKHMGCVTFVLPRRASDGGDAAGASAGAGAAGAAGAPAAALWGADAQNVESAPAHKKARRAEEGEAE
jgi:hypothetical protein